MKINRPDISELWMQVSLKDDVRAFEHIFHTLNAKLIKFCVFYVKQKEAAEDIVSNVFIKCWEARKSLTEIASLETYFFVAVKNQSLNYLKKYSSVHLVQADDSTAIELIDISNPQREMERKELHFILDQAISSLPPQACLVFRLIKEDGLRYKEVAEILNISPRTVQTQLFRAMQKLSALLVLHQTSVKKARRKSADVKTGLILAMIVLLNIFFTKL